MLGFAGADRGGALQADFVQQGTACRDSTAVGPGQIVLGFRAHSLRARYAGPGLHTRCPGPLVGEDQLAAGGAPLRALARRTVTLVLTKGGALLDDGYTGATIPRLAVTLTRRGVRTGVIAG